MKRWIAAAVLLALATLANARGGAWVPGHWEWQGDGHAWVPGYYVLGVRETARDRHHRNADQQPRDLHGGLAGRQAPLQLRDQVCERNIDEAAAGDDQEVRQRVMQARQ